MRALKEKEENYREKVGGDAPRSGEKGIIWQEQDSLISRKAFRRECAVDGLKSGFLGLESSICKS